MRFVSFFYDRISTSKGALRLHRKGKVSMKRTKLLALLTSISCVLLTIVLVGSYFTAAYAMMINKELGIVTTSVVTDDPSKNATYYASSFLKEDGTRDDDALTAWQKALCEQIQGEGSVLLTNNGALPMEKGLGVTALSGGAISGQLSMAAFMLGWAGPFSAAAQLIPSMAARVLVRLIPARQRQ